MDTLDTPRAAFFVSNECINKALPPIPCVIEQTFYDEDKTPLDHAIRIGKRKRYAEPERVFQSEAAANEFIADQIAAKARKLLRLFSRKTRSLRDTTDAYSKQRDELKALQRKAEMRLHTQPKTRPGELTRLFAGDTVKDNVITRAA